MKNKQEGDIVNLEILRDNKMINVPVTLRIIQMPLDQQDEIPPFSDNPKDFGDDQGKFNEQLKKECLLNFNESICNFLFR